MGSVPNCQKEIPARHAIRWFKCKLKPPKNQDKARQAMTQAALVIGEEV